MSKRPVLKSYEQPGDLSYSFRTQNARTLDEIDTLLQRQERLKTLLGGSRASEIEKEPDLFYNHERFRIWQAKARFRALVATVPTVIAVSTMLNGGRGGLDLIKRRYPIAVPAIASTYAVYFYVIHRLVGYNNQVYNE
jgi:hypothetical protein